MRRKSVELQLQVSVTCHIRSPTLLTSKSQILLPPVRGVHPRLMEHSYTEWSLRRKKAEFLRQKVIPGRERGEVYSVPRFMNSTPGSLRYDPPGQVLPPSWDPGASHSSSPTLMQVRSHSFLETERFASGDVDGWDHVMR